MATATVDVPGDQDDEMNAEKLTVEDQLFLVAEILERDRDTLESFASIDSISMFVKRLVEQNMLSTFVSSKLDGQSSCLSKKLELLHTTLCKKMDWNKLQVARKVLLEVIPDLSSDIWTWNKDNLDIVFLQIKYLNNSRHGHDNTVEPVEVDGLVKSSVENIDGSNTATVDTIISGLPVYNLSDRKYKGVCFIVNNMDYKEARKQGIEWKDREGSDADYKSIKKLFMDLKFDVEAHQNLSKKSLDHLILDMSSYDKLKNYSCFVTIFLSHGKNNSLYCTDGQQKCIDEIINSFKGDSCSALNGVPKWFIIQACRGEQLNKEIKLQKDAGEDIYYNCIEKQSMKPISIPECADFYISYATAPGYYSCRHPVKGTWFIQCLLEILEKYHKAEDVNTMMTRVNRKVAFDCVGLLKFWNISKLCWDFKKIKQMPCHVNMLTHALCI